MLLTLSHGNINFILYAKGLAAKLQFRASGNILNGVTALILCGEKCNAQLTESCV
jgi:hypothetical protein